MSLLSSENRNKRFRHRVQEIKLDPSRSRFTVAVKLLVDDELVHDLPEIKKNLPLCWSGPSLPCDVYEFSSVTVQVTGMRGGTESHTYQMAEVLGQDSWFSSCEGMTYAVKLKFLSEEAADKAYTEAFIQAEQMVKPNTQHKTSKVKDAFRALLELGSTMAELDPSGGAKVVFAVCTKAWEHLEEQSKLNDDVQKLIKDLASLTPSLDLVKRFANAILKETVVDMLNLIEDVSLFILTFFPRGSRVSLRARLIHPPTRQRDQIDSFTERFKRLRNEFQTRMIAQLLVSIEELRLVQATTIIPISRALPKAGEAIFIEVELEYPMNSDIEIPLVCPGGGPLNTEMIRSILKPVDLAVYDFSRACMRGTRQEIIRDITSWVREPSAGQSLAWVTGLASIGKSSVATSLCQQLDEQDILAASFFCRRDPPELSDPCRILATIAYHLALQWDAYGHALQAAIAYTEPNGYLMDIEQFYNTLWTKPLQTTTRSQSPNRTLTIVIDALNECGNDNTRKQLVLYLRDILQTVPWLRIVVTSRLDVDIQECFKLLDQDCFIRFDLLAYEYLGDMRVFIRAQLGDIEKTVDSWPEDAVDELSIRSNGLFVWAQAACGIITGGYDPCSRLEQVLARAPVRFSFPPLGELYLDAIKSVMGKSQGHWADSQHIDTYRNILDRLPPLVFLNPPRDDTDRVLHPWFMGYLTGRLESDKLNDMVNIERR